MQRREHQMPGLGRRQYCRNRFRIAHLSHQNHVRTLAQNASNRACKIGRIPAHFDLLDDGLPIRVQKLNRILNGDHMIVAIGVDQIEQGGQRRTFTASRGSRHQNQSLPSFRQPAKEWRQV